MNEHTHKKTHTQSHAHRNNQFEVWCSTNLVCRALRIPVSRNYTVILSHVPWKSKSAFPLFRLEGRKKNCWLSFLIGPFTHKRAGEHPCTQTKSWNSGQLVSYTLFSPCRLSVFHIVSAPLPSDSLTSLAHCFFWSPSIYTFAVLLMPNLCACCHLHIILGVLAAQFARLMRVALFWGW